MGFVIQYKRMFKVTVKATVGGKAISAFSFKPTNRCRRLLKDHQLIFKSRAAGFDIYYANNPQADDPLMAAIDEETLFGFVMTLSDKRFLNRYEPGDIGFVEPRLYLDNLQSNGNIQPASKLGMSLATTVAKDDAVKIYPKVFTVGLDMSGGNAPTKIFIKDKFNSSNTIETVVIEQESATDFKNTVVDLTKLAEGPYSLKTNAPGSKLKPIYISDELAGKNYFGIVDLYWNKRQDAVADDGRVYSITFKNR